MNSASHVGGDAFLVTYHKGSKECLSFNGSGLFLNIFMFIFETGEAPHEAQPEVFSNGIPIHGYKSSTVPGLVSTWFAAHEKYGKLPMTEILSSAIDYADNGFPISDGFIGRVRLYLQQYPNDGSFFTEMGILQMYTSMYLFKVLTQHY